MKLEYKNKEEKTKKKKFGLRKKFFESRGEVRANNNCRGDGGENNKATRGAETGKPRKKVIKKGIRQGDKNTENFDCLAHDFDDRTKGHDERENK